MQWKKGRGRLGVFEPLLGNWVAEVDSERGPVRCERSFERVLEGKYVQLDTAWLFADSGYLERCLFGVAGDKQLTFWSFTSDGKQSVGHLADGSDVHPQALCFEAKMPAGLARQVYWPAEGEGFLWAVESRRKQGWNRFTEHRYRAAE